MKLNVRVLTVSVLCLVQVAPATHEQAIQNMGVLQSEVLKLRAEIAKLSAEMEELVKELLADIGGINLSGKVVDQKLAELKGKKSNLEQQIAALKSEMSKLEKLSNSGEVPDSFQKEIPAGSQRDNSKPTVNENTSTTPSTSTQGKTEDGGASTTKTQIPASPADKDEEDKIDKRQDQQLTNLEKEVVALKEEIEMIKKLRDEQKGSAGESKKRELEEKPPDEQPKEQGNDQAKEEAPGGSEGDKIETPAPKDEEAENPKNVTSEDGSKETTEEAAEEALKKAQQTMEEPPAAEEKTSASRN
ncbi:MAG: hypothetical protein LBR78_01405 [Holosporales bacterium]|nr:hypothetical protein [Holosporales bacterium]